MEKWCIWGLQALKTKRFFTQAGAAGDAHPSLMLVHESPLHVSQSKESGRGDIFCMCRIFFSSSKEERITDDYPHLTAKLVVLHCRFSYNVQFNFFISGFTITLSLFSSNTERLSWLTRSCQCSGGRASCQNIQTVAAFVFMQVQFQLIIFPLAPSIEGYQAEGSRLDCPQSKFQKVHQEPDEK